MSKTTEEFREHLFVLNGGDYAKAAGIKVYVAYRPAITGRGGMSARWQIVGNGFKTDPDAHWQDYGQKTFGVYARDEKDRRLQEALAWASEQYGIPAWERSPFGAYVPTGTVAAMKDRLKQAKANPDLKAYYATIDLPEAWETTDGRHRADKGLPVVVTVAAYTRHGAATALWPEVEVDPSAFQIKHPDALQNMVEGQVTAPLARMGTVTLKQP